MNRLRLRYEPDDDWSNKLVATCETKGFAGEGGAWFNRDDIRAFANATKAFPLSLEAPPNQGGFYDKQDLQLFSVNLGLRFEQHNAKGLVRLTVELATKVWTAAEQDLQTKSLIRFLVTYSDLSSFGSDLSSLIDGTAPEVTLTSSA